MQKRDKRLTANLMDLCVLAAVAYSAKSFFDFYLYEFLDDGEFGIKGVVLSLMMIFSILVLIFKVRYNRTNGHLIKGK
ncbi:MAG: hypothetical protein HRT47_09975 [Candidatus Caenarcaniphilales bacterium]|nr:hypothetical protein [Candidatus Caenarcaniphilales bacterium]